MTSQFRRRLGELGQFDEHQTQAVVKNLVVLIFERDAPNFKPVILLENIRVLSQPKPCQFHRQRFRGHHPNARFRRRTRRADDQHHHFHPMTA